ncbi:MAG: DegV family protein, partial [Actinobacteria bacterium]|nr:DegV family protein [Actinomycetota bacterium]
MTATAPSGGRHVALVTDSSACLPAEEVARLGITVVPIVLVWHGIELRDGVDITPAEFWRRLATDPELPTTSTMSPGAYLEAFDVAARQGHGVVCTCLPRRLSTMYEAALIARRELDGHVPVDVVETGGAAMACGFPTLLGARSAAAGADQRAVLAAVERAIPHSEILAVIDDLDYLVRSGRVPALVGLVVGAFPSTFVLRLHNRRIGVGAKFGSRERAIAGMVERVRRRARG